MSDTTGLEDTLTQKARLAICANSENAAEAAEVMAMLGVHPSQEDGAETSTLPTPIGFHAPHILRPLSPVQGMLFGSQAKNRTLPNPKGGQ
jgi:hypothetical protein